MPSEIEAKFSLKKKKELFRCCVFFDENRKYIGKRTRGR